MGSVLGVVKNGRTALMLQPEAQHLNPLNTFIKYEEPFTAAGEISLPCISTLYNLRD